MSTEVPWGGEDAAQKDKYEEFLRAGSGQWVTLYGSWGELGSFSGLRWSALLPKSSPPPTDPSWELLAGPGEPGFAQYHRSGGRRTVYERVPSKPVEPLVHLRDFHGLRAGHPELSEQFRLLFNLWADWRTGDYFYFDKAGNQVKAAEVRPESVRVLTSLVRRYQAARQLCLALYIDSTLLSHALPEDDYEWRRRDEAYALDYYRGKGMDKPYSRLFGKKLLPPPARKECGLWPFEPPRRFEQFVIAVDDLGREQLHTSEPETLANYFGKNPDSPHYLTPVFFRRAVLDKYYADADKYSVVDGMVGCAGLWGLRLDNDVPDHVMVFLGDLGRDIPYEEAQYWRSFNIPPPEKGVSETLFRRAFLGQFADAQSFDLRFARLYERTSRAWEAKFGWPLFLPLHDDDRHVLAKLHIPAGDGPAEFDEQILYLAKLTVDSLNEKELKAVVGPGPKGEKGLGKLERFLAGEGVDHPDEVVRPLAHIQGLRSRSSAHRKGADFDITVAIGDSGRRDGFELLLGKVSGSLAWVRAYCEGDGDAE